VLRVTTSRLRLPKPAMLVLRLAWLGCGVLISIGLLQSSAFAGQMAVSWLAPTQNTDGSPLTNLAGYLVYWGCGGTGYPNAEQINDPAVTAHTVSNVPDGQLCRTVVTARNSAGVESAFSNEASKLIPDVLPGAPTEPPTISYSESAVMAEPTFVEYDQSTFNDDPATDELSSSATWQTGDIVLVFGGCANNGAANQLGTPTVSGGSGTGLTFSLLSSINNAAANDDTQLFLWSATAAGNGSGQIASVTTGTGIGACGLSVVIYRGTDGLGTPVTLDGSTAKTINVTTTQANSHVALMMADWNAVGDVTVTATPSGTVRLAIAVAGQADFFTVTTADLGAIGTYACGIASHTGTVDMSGIAVEVKGTAAAGNAGRLVGGNLVNGMLLGRSLAE